MSSANVACCSYVVIFKVRIYYTQAMASNSRGGKYTIGRDFCLDAIAWIILGLHPANERRRYFVTTSLIGWEQA